MQTRGGPTVASARPYVRAVRFDWLTPAYDILVLLLGRERRWKPQLVAQVLPKPGMRILDLGCGTGTLTIALARAEPRAHVVGLDGDPRILARAQRKAAAADVEVDLVEGLAQAPPLPPRSFDVVVSSLLFHHLRPHDKELTLRSALELLRPGGKLLAADWGRAQDALMWLASLSVRMLDGPASTRDSLAGALPALIARAGFSDVEEAFACRTAIGSLRITTAVAPEARGSRSPEPHALEQEGVTPPTFRCRRPPPTQRLPHRNRTPLPRDLCSPETAGSER